MSMDWVPLPRHTAKVGEILAVRWSDYYGAAMFGDRDEIVCLPHKRCRLEVVATAEGSHPEVNFILPGQVIRHKRSVWFLDRFELPSGTAVWLWHFVGFKLRLAPDVTAPIPSEEALLDRMRGKPEGVTVS